MRLRTVTSHPAIAPFIHSFWIFESQVGLPEGDARTVVPNGRHKLIIPYRNGLSARRTSAGETSGQYHPAGSPVVIGLWEEPSIISSTAEPTCTIGVEFHPNGLTRFLPSEAHELTQRIVPISDLLGIEGRTFSERILNAESVESALALVQRFLLTRLAPPDSPIVDAALRLLSQSDYRMEVNELERRMGYTRRHLHGLFLKEVGLPPKRLANVLAFERLYGRFSQRKSVELLKRDALQIFYDQSHFIRTFRRYTGFAPGRFAELENEFGRLFYLPATHRPEQQ